MHMDRKRLTMRPHTRCPSVPASPTVWPGRSQTVSDIQTLLRGLGHPHSPPPVALGVGFPGALSSHSTFHVPGLYKQFTTVPRKQQRPVRGPSSTGPGATGLQQTAGQGRRAWQYWKELRSHLVQLSNSRMGKPRHGTRPCIATQLCSIARKERQRKKFPKLSQEHCLW